MWMSRLWCGLLLLVLVSSSPPRVLLISLPNLSSVGRESRDSPLAVSWSSESQLISASSFSSILVLSSCRLASGRDEASLQSRMLCLAKGRCWESLSPDELLPSRSLDREFSSLFRELGDPFDFLVDFGDILRNFGDLGGVFLLGSGVFVPCDPLAPSLGLPLFLLIKWSGTSSVCAAEPPSPEGWFLLSWSLWNDELGLTVTSSSHVL